MRTCSDSNDKELHYRYIGNSHLEFFSMSQPGFRALHKDMKERSESGPRCAARILRLGALLRRLPVIHHVRFLHHRQSLPSADEKSLDHWLSLVFEYLSHLLVYQGLRAAEGKTEEGEGEERRRRWRRKTSNRKKRRKLLRIERVAGALTTWRLIPPMRAEGNDIGVTKGHKVVLKWRV